MFQLDEQTQMVAGVVRQWCQSALAPRIPALEAGTEMPFDLMKKMAKTFGFDAMLGGAVKKRIAKLRAGDAAPDDAEKTLAKSMGNPMLMHVVVKELSRVSPGFAMGFGVSVGLVGGAIVSKGTADQIERWGLPVSTMQQIGSWCLTEPGAGSDAFGSMRTTARATDTGYVLTGSKTFITNGPGADVFLVYAKLDDGVATFIVERGMTGVTVGPPFKKMGMRDSPTSEVFFEDVVLGPEHLLGGRGAAMAARIRRTASATSARAYRRWRGASSSAATTRASRTFANARSSGARSASSRPCSSRSVICSSSCAPSRTSCIASRGCSRPAWWMPPT